MKAGAAEYENRPARRAGPLMGMELSISRAPWRLGPAWAVLAAAFGGGLPLNDPGKLLQLLGAVCLADLAWGALWAPHAEDVAPAAGRPPPSLPYAQPEAPLSRWLDWLERTSSGAGWQESLVALGLVSVLSILLGPWALALSLVLVMLALFRRAVVASARRGALLVSLCNVGLPWALGVGLSLNGQSALSGPVRSAWALGAALILLDWGAQCCLDGARRGVALSWAGMLAVVAALAAAQLPGAAMLVAGLFLAPFLYGRLAQLPNDAQASLTAFVSRSGPWWWGSLAISALALRQLLPL